VLLCWLVLDEKITATVIVGSMLIIGGVAALLAGERRRAHDP
jgi:drug/metabolite transporter (DMT)-like permease